MDDVVSLYCNNLIGWRFNDFPAFFCVPKLSPFLYKIQLYQTFSSSISYSLAYQSCLIPCWLQSYLSACFFALSRMLRHRRYCWWLSWVYLVTLLCLGLCLSLLCTWYLVIGDSLIQKSSWLLFIGVSFILSFRRSFVIELLVVAVSLVSSDGSLWYC